MSAPAPSSPPTPEPPPTPAALPGKAGAFSRWFAAVHLGPEARAELEAVRGKGAVVVVMRSAGVINYLYVRWMLRKLGFPRLRAVIGLRGFFSWLLGPRPQARQVSALKEAAAKGESALVFLKHPSFFSATGVAGVDPFPALVQMQRALPTPVLLVPALLVWSRRPQHLKPSLLDVLFGSPESPGAIVTLIAFLRNYKRAFVRVGKAIDLAAFARERPTEAEPLLARKIRGALHQHLARETRAVLGPPLKKPARLLEEVMRDRSLREVLERVAEEKKQPLPDVEREAARDLTEIASRFSPRFIELMRPLLRWIFNKLYDGVEVDEAGLARLRKLSAEAPVVLCPSHKSHIDYLILSYVFYEAGLTPPHVAAGINLSFWPFGSIARKGGAYFIRRTFKGDKVYTAVMRAYVKRLMRDRFPQEFFIEGGRSRTGKLLFPKTGLLSMEVDAWLDGASDDVLFVPIAVDYEKLVEGKSYAKELAGGEKQKEDLKALVGARKVLRSRYGRIYIQLDEPISLKELAAQRLGKLADPLTIGHTVETRVETGVPSLTGEAAAKSSLDPLEAKRQLVQHLANRISYGINNAITLTPMGLVAAALLSHLRRGISAATVARRIEMLRYIAREQGARVGGALADSPNDPREPGAIQEALKMLEADGFVWALNVAGETIYRVPEERRALLDFYRNNVIHRYVALSLIAMALLAAQEAAERGGPAPTEADVRDRSRWLSRLFKLEFMYRVGATFDVIFDETLAFLVRLSMVRREDGVLHPGTEIDGLRFLADLIRAYAESYLVAVDAAMSLSGPVDGKGLVKIALERGRASFLAGRLQFAEALSKALLDNAVEWLKQQGALEAVEGTKTLRTSEAWRKEKAEALKKRIEAHLGLGF